ncbi:MAG: murein L,D-transpeptidase, partial [Gemmatimonadetes bacterium]|nr:murein L,D-transpeptidase [Gemmatimonadota bacterium]
MKRSHTWALAALALASACSGDDPAPAKQADTPVQPVQAPSTGDADLPPVVERQLTPEELEAGRNSNEWTSVVQLDTTGGGAAVRNPEKWEMITTEQMNTGAAFLPLGGDVGGPSVYRVQILLDRALFSPGMMDGHWGKNTAKAVFFFQQREGLRTTGRVDSATYAKLAQAAGSPEQLVVSRTLSAEDVKGPFMELPDSIYDLAKLDCTCFESLTEKLSESFHTSPELLARLNPGVELNGLQAGQQLNVPNVRDVGAKSQGEVAELVVSGKGSYVHAVDASGRILYHFPSTLGGTYEPSPQGEFKVTSITKKPWWHFQPALLEKVPDDRPDAKIPPGPNNSVGMVWMSLSAPHYGIHGTKSPETIGYATSAGCVRLTNWDALFLADRMSRGTPVRFRDIQGRTGDQDASGSGSRVDSIAKARARGETGAA